MANLQPNPTHCVDAVYKDLRSYQNLDNKNDKQDLGDLISTDIRLFSLSIRTPGPWLHRHPQLSVGIKKWNKILQSYNHKKNTTVGIIHNINFEYFCILYAAISLGFNFVILDSRFDENSHHKDFLPLDLIIYDELLYLLCDSIEYWQTNANYLIDARQIPCTGTTENNTLLSMPLMDFDRNKYHMLSAMTSGTTAKPKKIVHNYQYFIDIAKRNCKVLNLSGKAAHVRNLYHGSSLPVYFLPSVMSCDLHLCLTWVESNSNNDEYLYEIMCWTEYLDINHIFFPYSSMLVDFLEMIAQRNMQFTNLKLYTLYYIDPDLKKYIKNRNIEIISIFGCTETSGPILVNYLNNRNADIFDPSVFYAPDDFFIIEPSESDTRIRSRCGTIDHVMNDRFIKLEDNCFKHIGRSDFYRINDIEVPLIQLQHLKNRLHINGEIVIDLLKQTLYLALWDKNDCISIQKQINNELEKIFGSDLINISKSANLNKLDFMSGIKPNQEIIRNYFRLLEKF